MSEEYSKATKIKSFQTYIRVAYIHTSIWLLTTLKHN